MGAFLSITSNQTKKENEKMKNQSCGGKYLSQWQGEGPRGRDSSPLYFQKGQALQDRRFVYAFAPDGTRVWSF